MGGTSGQQLVPCPHGLGALLDWTFTQEGESTFQCRCWYLQPTGASMVAARQCPALQNWAQVILPYEKGFEFLCTLGSSTVSEAP